MATSMMTTTPATETKLYVTNFPSSATRQQLQQFFSRFGRVQECAIMWNSYAFVHYGSMDEARRALDQSNGAMFLNRKLIVQLSTSRFRPQPKDMSASSLSQPAKQLMGMGSSSSPYHHLTNGESLNGKQQQQQQATSLSSQYPFSDFNYELMTLNQHRQPSSPTSDSNPFLSSNTYRAPSPVASQYSSELLDQLTASSLKPNPIKSNKLMKTDMGVSGEIPKLYCTNLPENCKAHDLQRLFSSFGHVTDCVILWDYYAFVTYKSFLEAERAAAALNGFTWKDRRLIVEWSRASGRRQQQQTPPPPSSSTPPRLGSFTSNGSTPSSPRSRPSSILTHSSASNGPYYGNNSPKLLSPLLPSPLKSQSPHHTFNQNLALMSMMQQQQQYHPSMSFGPYSNGENSQGLSHENHSMYDSLTNLSPNRRLDLSQYLDSANSSQFFPSGSDLPPPSSPASLSNVYQPSDIVSLLELASPDVSGQTKSIDDITNSSSSASTFSSVPPSCSSAAAAGVAALFQENLLSSLFSSLEPFSKLFPNDEPNNSSSRYAPHHLSASPLLTTAPDYSHSPMYYGHNISWH